MDALPLVAWLGTGLWLAACLTAAGLTLIRRRRGLLPPESGFFAVGLVFLGLAPAMSVVVSWAGGSASIWGGSAQLLVALLFFAAAVLARRRRLNPNAEPSRTTFREKSAALILVTLGIVFAGYFAVTWNASLAAAIPAFIASLVVVIAIMVIGHLAIALSHAPFEEVEETHDDRDREVDLLSLRNAHYVLAVGIWIVPFLAIFSFEPLLVANAVLALIVLSEIAYYGSLMAYYRFGTANG
jgi:drug/metabolite transporter (DMT)-like permease